MIYGLVYLLFITNVSANEKHNQLRTHEHGRGSFNMVIEGHHVNMELESSGSDIVGFEHNAKTKSQKTAIVNAKKKLEDILNVAVLPAAAGCKLDNSKISLKEQAEKYESTHSEFFAEYELVCSDPKKLTEITFSYFNSFRNAETLDVNIVGPKSQKKFEVKRNFIKINLNGIF